MVAKAYREKHAVVRSGICDPSMCLRHERARTAGIWNLVNSLRSKHPDWSRGRLIDRATIEWDKGIRK